MNHDHECCVFVGARIILPYVFRAHARLSIKGGICWEGLSTGRYKSRTGSTRTASPGRIDSDRLGSSRIMNEKKT